MELPARGGSAEERESGNRSSPFDRRAGDSRSMDRSKRKFIALVVLLGVFLGAFFLTPLRDVFSQERVEEWRGFVEARGALAPVVFLGVLVTTAVCGIPRMYPTILGGALFGVPAALVLTIAGSTAGAVASFLFARWMGRDYVEARLRASRFRSLRERLERHGFPIVVALRVFPLSNFVVTNYACGVAPIRARDYVLATALGMIPSTLLFVLLGAGLVEHDVRLLVTASMLFIVLCTVGAAWGHRLLARPVPEEG